MDVLEELLAHARARPAEIKKLKQNGAKIVGYVPGGYMPEELAYACDAIPVGLIRGGEPEPVANSEPYLFRLLDPFCRSQIGYRRSGKELLYQLPDLMVVPITDRNVTAIADSWQLYSDVPVFKFGVPRYTGVDHELEYYVDGLVLLKQKLEELTGVEIKDKRLEAEIALSNKIRGLLKEISFSRKAVKPGISGKNFIKLNHATYYTDRRILVSALTTISRELSTIDHLSSESPRIMLVGSTMAEGDYKLVDLLEETGANIVIEEFSEGIRHYQHTIQHEGNLIRALADAYLNRRVPPAFFHGAIKERFDHLLGLVNEFKVNGVVWYSLMYRDSYDREGLLFSRLLEKEAKVPLLKINSNYDISETAAMRTRVETFIEMIKQRM